MRIPLAILLASCLADAAGADLFDVEVQKVADGVYVAARPEPLRPFVEGNATIIINDGDVVVVDANGSPHMARNVIAQIRKLTGNPVRYLIQTHIHRDHRFGAQEYVKAFPGVEIVAHPIVEQIVSRSGDQFVKDTIARLGSRRAEVLEEIRKVGESDRPGKGKVVALLQRLADEDLPRIVEEYRGTHNLPPTLTVDRKLVLHRGARTIEVLFLGHGDTDHDLVVFLPQEKLVCAGDMVVHPFPYGYSTAPLQWLATLGKLAALPFDRVIPGHGAVQSKEYVERIIALLQSMQRQVGDAIAAGATLEETRKRLDLSEFTRTLGDDPIVRYFFDVYFVEPNVAETYKALAARK